MHEQVVEEGQDLWMLCGLVLPGGNNGLVVTKEANPLVTPAVAPGEGCCRDVKQLLPLD